MTLKSILSFCAMLISIQLAESLDTSLTERSLQKQSSEVETFIVVDKVLQTLSLCNFLLSNFLNPTRLAPNLAISLGKTMEYTSYINLTLPASIQENLDFGLNAFPLITHLDIPIPEKFQEIFPEATIPSFFEGKHIHSSYLFNQWSSIIVLTAIIALAAIVGTIKLLSQPSKNTIRNVVFNGLWMLATRNLIVFLFFNSYGYSCLFMIVELQTLDLSSLGSILSFIVCILFTSIALILVFKLAKTFYKIQIDQIEKRDIEGNNFPSSLNKANPVFQTLYLGYKNSSLLQQNYLVFCIIKVIAGYWIAGCFYEYPLFQTLWLVIISLMMVYYLVTEKPIQDRFASSVTLIFEVIALCINFCYFGLACCQLFTESGCGFGLFVGYAVFALKIIVIGCSHLFGWIYFGLCLWEIHRKAKLIEQKSTWEKVWLIIQENQEIILFAKSYNGSPQTDNKSLRHLIRSRPSRKIAPIVIPEEPKSDTEAISTPNNNKTAEKMPETNNPKINIIITNTEYEGREMPSPLGSTQADITSQSMFERFPFREGSTPKRREFNQVLPIKRFYKNPPPSPFRPKSVSIILEENSAEGTRFH